MIRREGFAFGWNASHEFLHFLTRRGSASQRRPCRKQLTVRSSAREMNQLAGRQIDGDKIVGRLGLLAIAGRMILVLVAAASATEVRSSASAWSGRGRHCRR